MKKFFLVLAGAAVLAGTMAATPEPALAKHMYGNPDKCGIVKRGRYVWKNGHRKWVIHKFRRCHLIG